MDYRKILDTSSENPLENLVTGGGFCGILRKVACIGDSLSSGEFESLDENNVKGYHDYYDYSWGQFMAREAGLEVLNFSRGGMSAEEYCESFAEANGFWDPEKKCRAYIIALGWNDVTRHGADLGDIGDIDLSDWRNNRKTFAGYYGQIISRIKEIEPKARIFIMTIPKIQWHTHKFEGEDRHAELMYEIAKLYEYCYVLDIRKYAPLHDEFYREHFYLGGHLNPMGYQLFSRVVMTYIDYIIRKNTEDFAQIGFLGTGFHNSSAKW